MLTTLLYATPETAINKTDYSWIWGSLAIVLMTLFFIVNRQMKLRKRNFQLEDSSSQLQMIINTTVEAILVSENKKCIFMNRSARDLFCIKQDSEFLGKSLVDFVDDDYKKIVKSNLKKDSVELYEIYIQKTDGKKVPVLTKGTNIVHQGKNIRVSSIIDISEMKQKEQQLLQQTKLASMGEMIGNIAHQWRQPLSVISTSATGMKLQKEYDILKDEDLYNHCDKINENAQYLSQTIDDFTNFIKGESKPVQFNLKNDTDSFIKLVDSSIKLYNINVILDLQEDIKIKGYPSELIQCFINIFNNARDALLENNEEDNRYVFIEQRSNNDEVKITFTDNAGGIPNDIINSIFEPYFTTKHKSQGTGLGLHMSYNLVVNGMQGIIIVKNDSYEFNGKEHRGAKFTITIPLNHKA